MPTHTYLQSKSHGGAQTSLLLLFDEECLIVVLVVFEQLHYQHFQSFQFDNLVL